jgi:hypothetical protein
VVGIGSQEEKPRREGGKSGDANGEQVCRRRWRPVVRDRGREIRVWYVFLFVFEVSYVFI